MIHAIRFFSTLFLLSTLSLTASGVGTPSHTAWNGLLQRHVAADGLVDYAAFGRDNRFHAYLNTLSASHPDDSWSENEQLAYWINAYNAFTVKLVTDNLPIKSIKDLGEPWDMKFIEIEGKRYSLNDIEHEILRKQFDEPRIHFAVNCASISCPPLMNRAFIASRMEAQLDEVSRKFVNDKSRNQISTNEIKVSKVFEWFRGDFDKTGGVVPFIKKYARTSVSNGAAISFLDYDWSLNAQ